MLSIKQLPRSIAIVDYIIEGHSVSEAVEEFNLSKFTINRSIELVGSIAFYSLDPNSKELQMKYRKLLKVLNRK